MVRVSEAGFPGLPILSLPALHVTTGTLDATGRGSYTLTVPDEPALAGISFYFQAVIYDPLNFGAVTVSNLVTTTVQ